MRTSFSKTQIKYATGKTQAWSGWERTSEAFEIMMAGGLVIQLDCVQADARKPRVQHVFRCLTCDASLNPATLVSVYTTCRALEYIWEAFFLLFKVLFSLEYRKKLSVKCLLLSFRNQHVEFLRSAHQFWH